MRKENQDLRRAQIERAAYALMEEKGFLGLSMLSVAKRAKASNETLYRWYGDKVGLFKAMVTTNAAIVKAKLLEDLQEDQPAIDAIQSVSPLLLELLLSERAIALNRAATADASGMLGQALAEAGRNDILPLIAQLFERAQSDGLFEDFELPDICALYMDLLVGDMQMRRAIGTLNPLSEKDIRARVSTSFDRLMRFC